MRTVILTGPECSGKTQLAQQLSARTGCPWFAEYAVEYLDELGRPYQIEDLSVIAENQFQLRMNECNRQDTKVAIYDTSSVVLSIWAIEKFGKVPQRVQELFELDKEASFLLCKPDIPWEEGPFRENPQDRDRLFDAYHSFLKENNLRFTIIKGNMTDRLRASLRFIRYDQ